MNIERIKLLERAFANEIENALSPNVPYGFKTTSKLARTMAKEGYLNKSESGYTLSELGRLTYCLLCENENA